MPNIAAALPPLIAIEMFRKVGIPSPADLDDAALARVA
jgi:hypothetical protein